MNKEIADKVINIQTSEELDIDRVTKMKDNTLLKVRPDLFREWNFKRNDELGFDIYRATKGQVVLVWWICSKCKSEYDMTIDKRKSGRNCPYCSSNRINHTNSLASLNPELAKEWHTTKNGNLTPHNITSSSNQFVWWQCDLKHEWENSVNARARGGCPYCANKKTWRGFNDLWTTSPEIAELLLNPEDGYKYVRHSNEKVDWKCSNCNTTIGNKMISYVSYNLFQCPSCGDGISYAEKFMFNILKQLNIDFISRKYFDWSDKKGYDFYISSSNIIIETHGEQHYKGNFEYIGGRTLIQEQVNDRYKHVMAMHNSIKNYIVIDCRRSDFNFIRNNILDSDLKNILDLEKVDFDLAHKISLKSLVFECLDIWNSGVRDLEEIASTMNLASSTIRTYLRKLVDIGLCDYDSNAIKYETGHGRKRVVKLSVDGKAINLYNSLNDASKKNGVTHCTIRNRCNNPDKIYDNYRWMLESDYIELSNNN